MQKLFAGILFSISFVFLAVTVSSITMKNPTEKDRSAALGGIILGVPAGAGGAWIVWGVKKKDQKLQKTLDSHIETTFLELVQANQGKISTLDFAIATKLSLEDSKQYLDQKAKQLNADFNVSEDGAISYQFFIS
jgi:large subunit ribosomal protein L7/L12